MDKYASRRWRKSIRDVLNREWDPIGVGEFTDDEYDSYVGELAAMIRKNASDEKLLAYLEWVEVDHMALGPKFDHKRGIKVISALRALGNAP
jgi:hypothetical protein